MVVSVSPAPMTAGADASFFSGDVPSPGRISSSCVDTMECLVPTVDTSADPAPRHLLLVRSDGLIVPTQVYWTLA